jgi:hypothetical protein
MSVTAQKLGKSEVKNSGLGTIVREQIEIIDAQLKSAPKKWGRNCLQVELPYSFSIDGLDMKDIQRSIYSSIIKSLVDRKFKVKIELRSSKTFLYIAWVVDIDRKEIAAMNTLIAEHIIPSDKIQAFQDGTGEFANDDIPSAIPKTRTARPKKKSAAADAVVDADKEPPSWAVRN